MGTRAENSSGRVAVVVVLIFALGMFAASAQQLSPTFYARRCPNLVAIVRRSMQQAVARERRMAASILRMHFHDCFVQGCDASILLDDTTTFTGEKTAGPNLNSVRGFEVIDTIKSLVNQACGNNTVSCTDILTLATREGIVAVGGPSWPLSFGRRDSPSASLNGANSQIPGPGSPLSTLLSMFQAKGLNARDMTALSGGHTVGFSRCLFFRNRIYTDPNINATFATAMQAICPRSGGDNNLGGLDVQTVGTFDNAYFRDLVTFQGLLPSDQVLFNNGTQGALVRTYSTNQNVFFRDFASAMARMANITPLTGSRGQVRANCRRVN